jgi:RNA polymerase sigma factor (sigma-70 family)
LSPLALSLRFLQTQSDAKLADLARAGHERAFEALVRRYRRELLAYCRRVGSVGTNAEDTLQQGLLQAWSAIRTGVEVRDPRAWLYRIVHNVAVSNQRRPVVVPVEVRETAGARGADQEAEQRMAARDALAGLAALPDLQREVMVGTAVDGMSHEELASALGLSSGAVRGLIYRARATLRAAAAAITPGPVISFALRSGSGPGTGLYEALAGSGTAGIGGILIKGGTIAATAGAIATATGISTSHTPVHHRATPAVAAAPHHVIGPSGAAARATRLLVADPTSSRPATRRGSAPDNRGSGSSDRRGTDDHGFASEGGDRGPGKTHSSSGGPDRGNPSGSDDPQSGHDGSHQGTSSGGGSSSGSGSDGSHSGSATTLSSGSGSDDHGGELSGTSATGSGSGSGGSSGSNTSSGSSGSSSSGKGSGDSLSGGGSTVTAVSSDDGGTASSDGVTTTTTSTSGHDGSDDAGHHGGK